MIFSHQPAVGSSAVERACDDTLRLGQSSTAGCRHICECRGVQLSASVALTLLRLPHASHLTLTSGSTPPSSGFKPLGSRVTLARDDVENIERLKTVAQRRIVGRRACVSLRAALAGRAPASATSESTQPTVSCVSSAACCVSVVCCLCVGVCFVWWRRAVCVPVHGCRASRAHALHVAA